MITRTATSDKLMKINGMFVDGTDPRFASYLSIANTCPPAGHPNTEAFELDGGKEVCFNTTQMIAKGEQIMWKYHEIFDEPIKLVDFADPASCDFQIEQQEEDSDAVADAIESEAPPCPSGHSTNRSRADDEGYQCSRCLQYVLQGATLWGCDQYDCDFDLCCLCCEAWQFRTGLKTDNRNHTSACLDENSQCQTVHSDAYEPTAWTRINRRPPHSRPEQSATRTRLGHGDKGQKISRE